MRADEAVAAVSITPTSVPIASARQFFNWWREELLGLFPEAVRIYLRTGLETPVFQSEGKWNTYALTRDGLTVSGELVSAGGKQAGTLIRNANLWLLLGPTESVVRDAVLPLAAEESLDEAVGFELDRLTPLPAEKAWFGYRVTARDEAEKQLRLRLAVAPRELVEARVADLRAGGAHVLGVGLLDEFAGGARSLNLLPREQRDRPVLSRQILATRALSGLAALMAAAALVYPVWLKRESVGDLLPRVDKAKAAADVSSRVAAEIETLAKEHNFLLAKKLAQTPMAQLVEELSKQLPDNTWVQQLDVKPGPKTREVQIAGETGSSSALVEVLERSGLFANATFKSPLTKGATPNTERYLLAAELKLRDLPSPLPEESLVAPATATPGQSPPQVPAQPPALGARQ